MFLGRLTCLFNRHKAMHKSVKWTGFAYQGVCRYCHCNIQRKQGGGWRAAEDSTESFIPEKN
jgi:hypothetical protein